MYDLSMGEPTLKSWFFPWFFPRLQFFLQEIKSWYHVSLGDDQFSKLVYFTVDCVLCVGAKVFSFWTGLAGVNCSDKKMTRFTTLQASILREFWKRSILSSSFYLIITIFVCAEIQIDHRLLFRKMQAQASNFSLPIFSRCRFQKCIFTAHVN